jgi:Uncharacterized protein, involved in the regulation of septum location
MKVTEVKISKLENGGKAKAFASVTFDGAFVITGLRVMEGANGLFVAMPSQKREDKYVDTAFPVTKEFRTELQDAVLAEFNK